MKGISYKLLKCHLAQEIVHFSVFLYLYIILLTSLISFWRGSIDPFDPTFNLPLDESKEVSRVGVDGTAGCTLFAETDTDL